MKKLLLLILLFTALRATAQKHWLGVRSGVTFAGARTDLFEDADLRTGFDFGLTYEYFVTAGISLNAAIEYSQRGFKDDFYLRDDQGNDVGSLTTKFKYNYIAIPLTVRISGKGHVYPFASLGFVPAFLIHANIDAPEFSSIPSQDADVTDYATQLDLGGMLEAGGGYRITEKLHVTAAVTGQLSFNAFTNEDHFEDAVAKHYGFAILVGLKYKLGE